MNGTEGLLLCMETRAATWVGAFDTLAPAKEARERTGAEKDPTKAIILGRIVGGGVRGNVEKLLRGNRIKAVRERGEERRGGEGGSASGPGTYTRRKGVKCVCGGLNTLAGGERKQSRAGRMNAKSGWTF